jgi:hypothetical protein
MNRRLEDADSSASIGGSTAVFKLMTQRAPCAQRARFAHMMQMHLLQA